MRAGGRAERPARRALLRTCDAGDELRARVGGLVHARIHLGALLLQRRAQLRGREQREKKAHQAWRRRAKQHANDHIRSFPLSYASRRILALDCLLACYSPYLRVLFLPARDLGVLGRELGADLCREPLAVLPAQERRRAQLLLQRGLARRQRVEVRDRLVQPLAQARVLLRKLAGLGARRAQRTCRAAPRHPRGTAKRGW